MSNKLLTDEDREKIEVDKYEQSAQAFKALHQNFKKITYPLCEKKKRAVARVLEAVMFQPLEDVELFGSQEKELFAICQQVMYHKSKIGEYAMKRKLEKEKEGEPNE